MIEFRPQSCGKPQSSFFPVQQTTSSAGTEYLGRKVILWHGTWTLPGSVNHLSQAILPTMI